MHCFQRVTCAHLLAAVVPLGNLLSDDRPNIVVIVADDPGDSDLVCYGSKIPTQTPDELASYVL